MPSQDPDATLVVSGIGYQDEGRYEESDMVESGNVTGVAPRWKGASCQFDRWVLTLVTLDWVSMSAERNAGRCPV